MGLDCRRLRGPELRRPAGRHLVRRADQISDEDRTLLQTVARVIHRRTGGGTLADQLEHAAASVESRACPGLQPTGTAAPEAPGAAARAARDLIVLQRAGGVRPTATST